MGLRSPAHSAQQTRYRLQVTGTPAFVRLRTALQDMGLRPDNTCCLDGTATYTMQICGSRQLTYDRLRMLVSGIGDVKVSVG